MPNTVTATRDGARPVSRNLLWKLLVPLLLVAASLGMAWTVTAQHSESFSPRDEWVYLDYLQKLPHQGFIHQGEVVGLDPRARMACFGVRDYGPMGPPCGSEYSDLATFPQQAVNTADIYTPLYFAATRAVAAGIQLATGFDLFQAARLSGGLWLAGTMALFYGMMRSFRVNRLVTLGLGLAFIGSPLAWWTYTYISTDAPTFLLAAASLWAAHSFLRGRAPAWSVVALSVIAVLFKTTNLLTVGLIALYLLFATLWQLKRRKRETGSWSGAGRASRPIMVAVASVVLGVLAQGTWLFVRSLAAVGPSPDQGNLGAMNLSELARLSLMTIPKTIVSNSTINPSGINQYRIPDYVVTPLSWICIGAVIGSLWLLNRRSVNAPLVLAIVVSSIAFVPALAWALAQSQGSYYPLPARYGAPLVASMLLSAGLLIRNRWATYTLVAYGALLVVYVIVKSPALA